MDFTYENGYLDKLLELYPIKTNPIREIPESLVERINKAYDENNYQELINLFNEGVKKHDLKFPIECSYNSSLRNEKN